MIPVPPSVMQQLVADRHAALRTSPRRRPARRRWRGWFDRVVPAGAVPKPVAVPRPVSTTLLRRL